MRTLLTLTLFFICSLAQAANWVLSLSLTPPYTKNSTRAPKKETYAESLVVFDNIRREDIARLINDLEIIRYLVGPGNFTPECQASQAGIPALNIFDRSDYETCFSIWKLHGVITANGAAIYYLHNNEWNKIEPAATPTEPTTNLPSNLLRVTYEDDSLAPPKSCQFRLHYQTGSQVNGGIFVTYEKDTYQNISDKIIAYVLTSLINTACEKPRNRMPSPPTVLLGALCDKFQLNNTSDNVLSADTGLVEALYKLQPIKYCGYAGWFALRPKQPPNVTQTQSNLPQYTIDIITQLFHKLLAHKNRADRHG